MQAGGLAGKAAAGIAWLALQSVGARAAIFVSQIVLAQLLLPQDFGTIALASTITTIASVLVGFGVDDVLLQRHRSFRVWEGPAFWISMGFAVFGGLIVLLMAPVGALFYREPRLLGILSVLAIAMPLSALTTVSTVQLRVSLNFRALAFFGTAEAIGTQLLTILLAELHFGVYSFVLPVPVFAVLKAAAMWSVTGVPTVKIGRRFRMRQWKILFGRSTAVFGSKLLTGIISQAGYVVLGLLSTSSVVGLYFFAFRLSSQALRILAGNITGVLFPILTQLNADPARQGAAAIRAARFLAFSATPMCFLQAALAEPVMGQFFDSTWRPSILLVQILSLGLPFDAPAWVAGALLTARGQFRRALLYSAFGGAAFVILVAAGAYYGGATGVALAVAGYYVVNGPAYTYASLQKTRAARRIMLDAFVVAPVLSALTFGAAYLVADRIGTPDDHVLRALAVCLIGVPAYIALVRWFQEDVYRDAGQRFQALSSRIWRPRAKAWETR